MEDILEAGFHEIEDSDSRAEGKRKRRPCHHVDPPGAVQPRPATGRGTWRDVFIVHMWHVHQSSKSVSTFREGGIQAGSINVFMDAALQLKPADSLRPHSYATLIRLLAASGAEAQVPAHLIEQELVGGFATPHLAHGISHDDIWTNFFQSSLALRHLIDVSQNGSHRSRYRPAAEGSGACRCPKR
jgi:hypothetical protein